MRALLTRCPPVLLFLGMVLATAFVTYTHYRQRYVGAADLYGYYQQAELLRQGKISLPLELPVGQFPSAAPGGYTAVGDRALPQYPPGYPLLIPLDGFFPLPLFVPPVARPPGRRRTTGRFRADTAMWGGAPRPQACEATVWRRWRRPRAAIGPRPDQGHSRGPRR